MLSVIVAAAAIWIIGALMKTPTSVRWTMITVLYLAVVLLHLVFPVAHPLRLATGGTAAPWLVLGLVALVVAAYRRGLQMLRNRAEGQAEARTEAPANPGSFSETELNRYARHIVMREIGGPGQKKLKQAKVLVIGAGGLGSPALLYLAAAGVGTIGVVDDDAVDNSNLQRQVIHSDASIGIPKVHSAAEVMRAQNPFIDVRPYHRRLTDDDARALIADYDLVLDGTDNFETRYLVNSACVALGKPLVSGALTQWEGQISVFDPAQDAPCYQCIFPKAPAPGLSPSCAEAGVIGPLPGVIGSLMAMEAVKLVTGAGASLRGEMLIYDGLYGETRKIALKRRADCPCCGAA